eukprot:IDg11128t1
MHSSTPTDPRAKRFRFPLDLDWFFCEPFELFDAHLHKHGEGEVKFGGVLAMFMSSHEYITKADAAQGGLTPPKVNTVWDRFKDIVKECRAAVRANATASGISETYDEREQLIHGLIEAMDDKASAEHLQTTICVPH